MSLLAQIAIFLAAAVIAIPIFRRFKLGSVLGYLTAGIIIGPASLGLISSVETTQNIAQFGIVLLMFVIGLELQPSRLWVLRKSIFGLGSAQVVADDNRASARQLISFSSRPGRPRSSSALPCRCPRRRWRCNCSPSAGSSIRNLAARHSAFCCFKTSRSCPRSRCCRCWGWRGRRPPDRAVGSSSSSSPCSPPSSSADAMCCVPCCASSPLRGSRRPSRRRVS